MINEEEENVVEGPKIERMIGKKSEEEIAEHVSPLEDNQYYPNFKEYCL